MKKLVFICSFLVCFSCKQGINESDLSRLNGYWEIQEVVLPNGEKKAYPINLTVDFIELAEKTGYRKKMYPKLSGGFETTDDAEQFRVSDSLGLFYLSYKNELSLWNEELLTLTDDSFSVKNSDGITYHYKRFKPFNSAP